MEILIESGLQNAKFDDLPDELKCNRTQTQLAAESATYDRKHNSFEIEKIRDGVMNEEQLR